MGRNHFQITVIILVAGLSLLGKGQPPFPPWQATQSSTYDTATANLAIDGDVNTCSLAADPRGSTTPAGVYGWWQVDLGGVFTVYSVTVTSGDNSNQYDLNFAITVDVTNSTDVGASSECYYFNNGSSLQSRIPTTFTCSPNPLNGRYVTLKRRGGVRSDAIGFCEVNINYNAITTTTTTKLSSSTTKSTTTTLSSSSSKLSPVSPVSSSPIHSVTTSGSEANETAGEAEPNALNKSDWEKKRTTIICVVVIIGGLLLLGGIGALIYFKCRDRIRLNPRARRIKFPRKRIEIRSIIRASIKRKMSAVPLPDYEKLTQPIRDSDLVAYVANKKAHQNDFKTEFKKLPEDEAEEATCGRKTENKAKNRFANVLPYDHTLVPLQIEEYDEPEGDYINANFIKGFKNVEKMYIATQGPRPNTVDDFWRMIWQQNVDLIVMITSLVEGGKKKCERYWPESLHSSQNFHKIKVTLITEETYAQYAYREMLAHDERKEDAPPRTVRQMHFLTWSDKTRPDHFLSILSFRRKIRALQKDTKGPVLVHCSAGIGRTGTYIALDYLLEQLSEENEASVFSCVESLRHQRMGMVQTTEQYVFLHEALADGCQAGDTGIHCSKFIREYVEMAKPWADGSMSTLQHQFILLKKLKEFRTEKHSSGLDKHNSSKNRDKEIVAYDDGRPLLETSYHDGTDYINAVYADSYRRKDSFILTQLPLPETVVDFWRLIWDFRLKTIVLLDELDPRDDSCPVYWPREDVGSSSAGSATYGPFEVSVCQKKELSRTILWREFSVTNTKEKRVEALSVRQYQLRGWGRDDPVPSNANQLLELMNYLMANSNNDQIVIQCTDGAMKSGLFASAMYLIDMMKVEQVVDAFLASRFVAINRPQVVGSMVQYQFLHDLACTCLMQYNEYANCSPGPTKRDESSFVHSTGHLTIYANENQPKPKTMKGLAGSKPVRVGEF